MSGSKHPIARWKSWHLFLSPSVSLAHCCSPLSWAVCCAAAAAKLLQSCPTLCDPRDSSPPGFPVPGILQARTLQWVAISFSNAWKWKVKVKLLSRDPMDCSPPGSSIHGILQARVLEWGAVAFSWPAVKRKCRVWRRGIKPPVQVNLKFKASLGDCKVLAQKIHMPGPRSVRTNNECVTGPKE